METFHITGPFNGDTVKPVCNDHLYNKVYYLWFISNVF